MHEEESRPRKAITVIHNQETVETAEITFFSGFELYPPVVVLQYYTYLEEAGNGLSGAEKQRIALARAFLKKNNFYILDESTSNLDFATESIIFDMIYNKFKGKSMLIIAHRLSTVKNCDKIIVLENGEIAECGTHNELLEKRGKGTQGDGSVVLRRRQGGRQGTVLCLKIVWRDKGYGREISEIISKT